MESIEGPWTILFPKGSSVGHFLDKAFGSFVEITMEHVGIYTRPAAPTRSDPLQTVSIRACLYGRGACADFTLTSAALIKTNPTEWL